MLIPEKGTLRTAKVKVQTDTNGDATVLLKVPGEIGVESRVIKGGNGWFDTHHADDFIKIFISDEDDILGGGAGVIVSSYTDDDIPPANQGWYVPPSGYGDMSAIADMGSLLGGLYLKIVVKKGDNTQEWFRANIKWGSSN